ncbi:MAG TPA: GTPase Era [Bacillota bacterium]|nr:GTPase Era [Bacillota bacterium]HOP69462.1 GTPase Era [Bacillota bacterium]HPT34432.1 GTPase Era [Bacillota bacterium]HPZ65556.1 GTPase Era [Bacillota bacterium]HQD06430.1 GTPase Era [Bacillota bacterium]
MTLRSGFVALVGRPNVGKSTLVNSLVGTKVAITSEKPQTTRNRIRGILNREDAQIIFIDTPGLHKPKHKLGAYMTRTARSTFQEVDLICFLVEAQLPPGPGDRFIVELFQGVRTPVFLVLNKIDLADPGTLAEHQDLYRRLYPFDAVYALSALEGRQLETLVEGIIARLPQGPRYYPPEMYTDQPERFIAAEIIREKIIHLTREEIPFSVAVVVEEIAPREGKGILDIRAEIYVERESQQGIVIGKGGALLKEVGTLARKELEALFGQQVYLDLWVKVKRDWRNREGSLRQLGYD